jgi:membrane protease YdiL (CAAX protease family)
MTSASDPPRESLPQEPPAPAPAARDEVRPWGFWGTLGWGLLAVAVGFLAAIGYALIWTLTHQNQWPKVEDARYAETASLMVSLVPIAVLVVAVKMRKSPLRNYFALHGVPRHDLAVGIASLIMLIVVFEMTASLLGIDNGSKFTDTTYRDARLAGVLPLMWLAIVVVGPVSEELLFRGFAYRGWASSWLGVSGTIVLTSALWAVLHQQYNWLAVLFVFLMGVIFGWLRQRGSTTLTIVLHVLNNLVTTILVAVKTEWPS